MHPHTITRDINTCRQSALEWRQLGDRAHEAARGAFDDRPYTGTIHDPHTVAEVFVCPAPERDVAAARAAAAELAGLAYAIAGHYWRELAQLRREQRQHATPPPSEPLVDIGALLGQEPRLRTRDVLAALARRNPTAKDWTLSDLTAYLTRHDAAPHKSSGVMVVSAGRVNAALARRDSADSDTAGVAA